MTAHIGQVLVAHAGSDPVGPASELLLWDGRLDNRNDLVRELAVERDAADPALVRAAYERWGVAGLQHVIGDWSLVIHDHRRRCVVLASDYAGVRPLYYRVAGPRVHWSTDLGSLATAADSADVEEQYVRAYLERGGGAQWTPFKGILAVPAGHAVCVSRRGTVVESCWSPPVGSRVRYRDLRDYDAHLRELFLDAVRVRLQGAAPVAAELSGGLDSSSVVGMADRLIGAGVVPAPALHTVSYVHPDSTDVPFIRGVEARRGCAGVHLSTQDTPLVDAGHVGRSMPAGWGPLLHAAVDATRACGARVLLTGQNGDLVMGNWYDDSLQVAAALRRADLRRAVADALAWSRVTRVPAPHIIARALLAALPSALTPPAVYDVEATGAACLTTGFRKRTAAAAAPSALFGGWNTAPPERRRHFRALAFMREMRTLQRFEDAPDIDYTHPFGHRPLVEFLMSIPADVLCGPGEPRRLMRRALADLWPVSLQRRRSKSLFGGPWVQALAPLAARLLATPRWLVVERGWVDRTRAVEKLTRLVHGLDGEDAEVRHLVLLEHWLRNREAAQSRQAPAA